MLQDLRLNALACARVDVMFCHILSFVFFFFGLEAGDSFDCILLLVSIQAWGGAITDIFRVGPVMEIGSSHDS